jgi:hypothetical protein
VFYLSDTYEYLCVLRICIFDVAYVFVGLLVEAEQCYSRAAGFFSPTSYTPDDGQIGRNLSIYPSVALQPCVGLGRFSFS